MLTDEEKQLRAVAKARKANELLKNEAFTSVVEELKQSLFKNWQLTADAAARDRCWVAVNLVDKIVDGLGAAVANGKVAQATLDQIVANKAKPTR